MTKKAKITKLTPEQIELREELEEVFWQRLAERRAREREWEERQAQSNLLQRIRRSLRAARAAW